MNTQGWLRGMLSKSYSQEKYFNHVVGCIDQELTEWGYDSIVIYDWEASNDEVRVHFIIDLKPLNLEIAKKEIQNLQARSPYLIDQYLWTFLKKQGVNIQDDQYMSNVFGTLSEQ